ncbi:inner centromere protein-like [Lates japonicus]
MPFTASCYGAQQFNPALLQLQQTVQGLRDALCSAINRVLETLNEDNKALKEHVNLVEDGWRRIESQLREELKGKDVLLKKKSRKGELALQHTLTAWSYSVEKKRS